MARATGRGNVPAGSDRFEVVENNVCFPPESLNRQYFKDSGTTSVCPGKGAARHLTVAVDGQENPDAAWRYDASRPEAADIRDHVAFWRGDGVER